MYAPVICQLARASSAPSRLRIRISFVVAGASSRSELEQDAPATIKATLKSSLDGALVLKWGGNDDSESRPTVVLKCTLRDYMPDTGSIEVSFLGGASSIGASCALIRVAGVNFVVDCGVRYSGSSPLPDLSQLADTRVDAILVTHAHMDHTGGLPVLAEACPGAPVFATPPTIDLVGILLRDSLRLMNSPDSLNEKPELGKTLCLCHSEGRLLNVTSLFYVMLHFD